jgi:MFS family permease
MAEEGYGYVIVSTSFVLMTVMWTAFYSFGIFFKPLLNEFGWTRAVTAGAFSLCAFIQGLLSIAMGGLTDRLGPRIVMSICGILLGAGYLLVSQVSSLWHLYLSFSVILGVGMGGSFAPLMSLTARWFVGKRGMMTGIVAAGAGLGGLVGPLVSEILLVRYGWRGSYAIFGVGVLVLMVLGAQLLRLAPGQRGKRNGNEEGDGNSMPDMHQEGFTFGEAVRSSLFWSVVAMIFCLGFSVFAMMVHVAPHVTDLGFTPKTGANVLATLGAVCVAGRVVFGKVLDRIGNRRGFIVGYTIMTLSLFMAVFASSLSVLYLFAALFGFAFGACVTCESPLVADLFGLRSHGLLLGIVACGFTVGGSVGPFVSGYIFDGVGKYQPAFVLCGLMSCVGLFLAWRVKKPGPRTGH